MRLVILTDQRFEMKNGSVVGAGTFSYDTIRSRYLQIFDEVEIVARVSDPREHHAAMVAFGPGVTFTAAPFWSGALGVIRMRSEINTAVSDALGRADAVIGIAPGVLAGAASSVLTMNSRPFGIEVVGDPASAFSKGAFKHCLRPLIRMMVIRQLKATIDGASAVTYVTEASLQEIYPAKAGVFVMGISDVELPSDVGEIRPRVGFRESGQATIAFVGTLAQLYKAPDVLLEAFEKVIRLANLSLKLKIVGDGYYRHSLEALARGQESRNRIEFLGNVARDRVITELDRADLFVLPSRQEGLPRAMVEAMSRGLPCIGSNAGGIPELLPPEDMVPPNDAEALANKIAEVLGNPERISAMSARNLRVAANYRNDVLHERRLSFYQYIRDQTEEWFRAKGRA